MTDRRPLTSAQMAELQDAGGGALLGFLVITHDTLVEPIRVVSDPFDYRRGGHLYTGLPFEWSLVTDTEAAPRAKLRIPNIDRRIGQAIRRASTRPRLALEVLSEADFDLSAVPRIERSTPVQIYAFAHFELSQISADALAVEGQVQLFDPSGEPWPSVRATEDRFPGLFW